MLGDNRYIMTSENSALLRDKLEGLDTSGDEANRDQILSRFLEYAAEIGLDLYPAQEEAILELLDWKHVVLNTPTGSGKSLVAMALHFQAMAEGLHHAYSAALERQS